MVTNNNDNKELSFQVTRYMIQLLMRMSKEIYIYIYIYVKIEVMGDSTETENR